MNRQSLKRLAIYTGILAMIGFVLLVLWFALDLGLPRNLIVLLDDPDGKVGELEVSNDEGRVTLTKLREATGVSRPGQAPRAPFIMTEKEVSRIFGGALSGRPALPVTVTVVVDPARSVLDSAPAEIARIVAEIQSRPAAKVSIFGYAASTGNIVINHAASLFRARAVGSALAARGVDTTGYLIESILDQGTAAPAPGGVPNNRRVEVVIQ